MFSRWKFLDKFLPFWSDPGLRKFYTHYAADTDAEVERKRTVALNNIRGGNDVERFKRKHKVLTNIVHRRERKRRRRQRREDIYGWVKLVATLVAILGAVAGAVWWEPVSAAISTWIEHLGAYLQT